MNIDKNLKILWTNMLHIMIAADKNDFANYDGMDSLGFRDRIITVKSIRSFRDLLIKCYIASSFINSSHYINGILP